MGILNLFRGEMRIRFALALEKKGEILYTISAYTCTPEL
jgi:hypothetical protein